MAIKSYSLNGVPKPETATLFWQIYHPAGFTTIPTVTGAKRRLLTDWPATRGLQKSLTGAAPSWVNVFSEVTPSVANTWEALASHSGISLSGNYPYLRWILAGTIKAGTLTTPNECDLEMQGATFAINSSNVPQLMFDPAEENNYFLDATITVVVASVDGEAIYLQHSMKNSETLRVDCDAEEITYNGLLINPIRFSSKRDFWLDVPIGSVQLRFDDVGTTSVSIAIAGEYKHTL
jgi:hypothetical protein